MDDEVVAALLAHMVVVDAVRVVGQGREPARKASSIARSIRADRSGTGPGSRAGSAPESAERYTMSFSSTTRTSLWESSSRTVDEGQRAGAARLAEARPLRL